MIHDRLRTQFHSHGLIRNLTTAKENVVDNSEEDTDSDTETDEEEEASTRPKSGIYIYLKMLQNLLYSDGSRLIIQPSQSKPHLFYGITSYLRI